MWCWIIYAYMQETDKFWTNLIEITPGVSLKEGLNLMVSQSGVLPALRLYSFPPPPLLDSTTRKSPNLAIQAGEFSNVSNENNFNLPSNKTWKRRMDHSIQFHWTWLKEIWFTRWNIFVCRPFDWSSDPSGFWLGMLKLFMWISGQICFFTSIGASIKAPSLLQYKHTFFSLSLSSTFQYILVWRGKYSVCRMPMG